MKCFLFVLLLGFCSCAPLEVDDSGVSARLAVRRAVSNIEKKRAGDSISSELSELLLRGEKIPTFLVGDCASKFPLKAVTSNPPDGYEWMLLAFPSSSTEKPFSLAVSCRKGARDEWLYGGVILTDESQ